MEFRPRRQRARSLPTDEAEFLTKQGSSEFMVCPRIHNHNDDIDRIITYQATSTAVAVQLAWKQQRQYAPSLVLRNCTSNDGDYPGLGASSPQSLSVRPHHRCPLRPPNPILPPQIYLPDQRPYYTPIYSPDRPQRLWKDRSAYSSTYAPRTSVGELLLTMSSSSEASMHRLIPLKQP